MINSQEPKDGDFARYIENLSKLAPGQSQVIGPRAPGSQSDIDAQPRREQLKALRKAIEDRKQQVLASAQDSLFGRSAGSTAAHHSAAVPPELSSTFTGLGNLTARLASLAVVAGVVLIGLSFLDELPFQIDPTTGLQVLAVGIVMRFMSRAFGAKSAS